MGRPAASKDPDVNVHVRLSPLMTAISIQDLHDCIRLLSHYHKSPKAESRRLLCDTLLMKSTYDAAQPADGIELPTSASDGEVDKGIPIRDGLYIITNKMTRTVLDLGVTSIRMSRPPRSSACCCITGHPSSGSDCVGWSLLRNEFIGNQIWIVAKSDTRHTYTLRNLRHSTFLDLWAG